MHTTWRLPMAAVQAVVKRSRSCATRPTSHGSRSSRSANCMPLATDVAGSSDTAAAVGVRANAYAGAFSLFRRGSNSSSFSSFGASPVRSFGGRGGISPATREFERIQALAGATPAAVQLQQSKPLRGNVASSERREQHTSTNTGTTSKSNHSAHAAELSTSPSAPLLKSSFELFSALAAAVGAVALVKILGGSGDKEQTATAEATGKMVETKTGSFPVVNPPANEVREEAALTFAPQVPPPIARRTPATVVVKLESKLVEAPLTNKYKYNFWTYNGSTPGPFIRARVGDTLEVHHLNTDPSGMPHNIDFHAVTGVNLPPCLSSSRFLFRCLLIFASPLGCV